MKLVPKILPKVLPKTMGKVAFESAPLLGPKDGCPLEAHDRWELLYTHNGQPSAFCWDDYGRTIIFNDEPAGVKLLAFDGIVSTGAVLAAKYTPNIVGQNNWTLPFAKFIDDQNVIGFRLNNNESDELHLQVIQRKNGTWSTLATTPAADEANFKAIITNTKIVIYDDLIDHLIFDLTHEIQGEGHFGIVVHEWASGEQACLFDYSGKKLDELSTPCMTSDTTPYGECSASITLSGYSAWKGMNCSTASGSDAWITPTDIDPETQPVWLQWFFAEASPMVPTAFEIKPRAGMNSGWYDDNNPQHIQLYGLRHDGSPVLLFDQQLSDWTDGGLRSWDVVWPGASFYGVRLQILSTNKYEADGSLHTAIGNFKCYGTPLVIEEPRAFKFTFTGESPNPSNFKITYADSAKKWWIDGVEYSSGETAALVPDDGSVEHLVEIENSDITDLNFKATYIDGTIDDMQDWPLTGTVNFSNTNVSGDIANTGWSLTGNAGFSGTNVSGDIANTGWSLTGSVDFYSTNVSGDIANTGWALTGNAYFSSTNVSGDIANTGWALTGTVDFNDTQINDCSAPLAGWTSKNLRFNNCPLETADVDNIVVGIDNEGETDGSLTLSDTAPPSQTGLDAIASLESKGWTVTYDSP